MGDTQEFIIKKGVLKSYNGFGGDVVVPGGVAEIGKGAFYGRRSINSISLPEGVKKIGSSAFRACAGLTNVVLHQSINMIVTASFEGTAWLEQFIGAVIVGQGILIKYNGNDSHIEIPEGVRKISEYVFSGCRSLSEIKFTGRSDRNR